MGDYQNKIRRVNVVKKTRQPKSSSIVSITFENSVMLNVSYLLVAGTTRKKVVRTAKRLELIFSLFVLSLLYSSS